ncbi:DUF4199 domain-containing protein [Portibacter marinus]|uniref:DUF4199 domain-containing protein n=1 Tax=Portibacter marinus TaxID=2898660 RepID=UPI001F194581|nr:DUF4199 domain-containing protein [Portibacter marinus]
MNYKTELQWSAIFFSVTILWKVFEKMMGWHGENITEHSKFSILYDGLFIAVYLFAFWDKRRSVGFNGFPLAKGIKFGMIITCIITLLSPIVQAITHQLISPDFFPNIIDLAVQNNLMNINEAQNKFNLSNYIMENMIGTFALGTICSLVLAFVFRRKEHHVI